jgi:hypothetical protein
MDQVDLLKLLGQGSITVAALIILGRIVYRIGERMIAALDKLIHKLDEHTKADTAAWNEVRTDLAALKENVSLTMAWTGATPPQGTPIVGPVPYPVARERSQRAGEPEHGPIAQPRPGRGRSNG